MYKKIRAPVKIDQIIFLINRFPIRINVKAIILSKGRINLLNNKNRHKTTINLLRDKRSSRKKPFHITKAFNKTYSTNIKSL